LRGGELDMPRTRRGKRLVYVSEDVVAELLEYVAKTGIPLQKLVDEGLKNQVEMLRTGITLEELKTLITMAYYQRASGLTLIPKEILKYLEGRVDQKELEVLWREAGCWYGKYLKGKASNPAQHLAKLLKTTRWDLDEVEVREEGGNTFFRCVSTNLTKEETTYLRNFIEGAMNCLDYTTESRDEARGIIILNFKKPPPQGEAPQQ
jgi:hypothetical protein